jgi:hypothetical protein
MTCLLPFMMFMPLLPGVDPTAEDIMCRVAENQNQAQAARSAYVYDMNVFVRLKRANGKLAREESRDYVVAPTPKGAGRKLLKLEGKVFDGKREIPYKEPKFRYKGVDVDGEVTDSFARELMWKKGENGPMVDWFPLSKSRMKAATFTYKGEEQYRNYDVYKVEYEEHDEDDCWRGEVLVEKNEFQPVLVSSEWACKIPAAVKILLGINVTNLGVKIAYQRFEKGVWFPVSGGGELKLRVLFMYARTIAFSAKNSDFRKADVQSSVEFEAGSN